MSTYLARRMQGTGQHIVSMDQQGVSASTGEPELGLGTSTQRVYQNLSTK